MSVAVMYAGQIVEYTDVKSLFARPLHPYTRGLLQSIPGVGGDAGAPGEPPDCVLLDADRARPACIYRPAVAAARACLYAVEPCQAPQELREVEPGRLVRCCRALETLP